MIYFARIFHKGIPNVAKTIMQIFGVLFKERKKKNLYITLGFTIYFFNKNASVSYTLFLYKVSIEQTVNEVRTYLLFRVHETIL